MKNIKDLPAFKRDDMTGELQVRSDLWPRLSYAFYKGATGASVKVGAIPQDLEAYPGWMTAMNRYANTVNGGGTLHGLSSKTYSTPRIGIDIYKFRLEWVKHSGLEDVIAEIEQEERKSKAPKTKVVDGKMWIRADVVKQIRAIFPTTVTVGPIPLNKRDSLQWIPSMNPLANTQRVAKITSYNEVNIDQVQYKSVELIIDGFSLYPEWIANWDYIMKLVDVKPELTEVAPTNEGENMKSEKVVLAPFIITDEGEVGFRKDLLVEFKEHMQGDVTVVANRPEKRPGITWNPGMDPLLNSTHVLKDIKYLFYNSDGICDPYGEYILPRIRIAGWNLCVDWLAKSPWDKFVESVYTGGVFKEEGDKAYDPQLEEDADEIVCKEIIAQEGSPSLMMVFGALALAAGVAIKRSSKEVQKKETVQQVQVLGEMIK